MADRTILHVDMDAFFVSVELLDRPDLRGQPVVVGGTGDRGVVAAASYEARAFGVHSAMPSVRARRLCPHAVFLPGRHDRYSEVSRRVMAVFESFTPIVEPLSLDEAFLDVTGSARLHGDGPGIASAIRRRVLEQEGLTCSVGVAPSKFVAKLASEAAKPRATPEGPVFGTGVHVVPPDGVLAFLHPLPVQALWGVGPATLQKLARLGVRTVADLATLPVDTLTGAVGSAAGHHLHDLANGRDDRDVEPDREAKSIGHEETFSDDLFDPPAIDRQLVRMADAVAGRLRAHGVGARTVTVKVRFPDFRTLTRSVTLPQAVDTGGELTAHGRRLLGSVDLSPGVRLLGIHAGSLVSGGPRQLELFLEDRPDATRAIDDIRERFGDDAIGPAVLLGESGLRRKRRGEQQWGPS